MRACVLTRARAHTHTRAHTPPQVSVRVTYEAGDVSRLVREALALGSADTLVAAGGDGTVNEVVAALLELHSARGNGGTVIV